MTTLDLRERAHRAAPAALLVAATVLLFVFYYLVRADTVGVFAGARGWAPLTPYTVPAALHFVASALLLGVIPVALARALTGRTLRELGLGLGNWRAGLVILAIGIPGAIVAGKIAALTPAFRAVYPLDPSLTADPAVFGPYALREGLYYVAWEVLFRGVLLFGLLPRLGGAVSNAVQTALSVTAHFGRPLNETFSAIPAGLLFGGVDLKVGSIWYVAMVHWVVGVSMDWFIVAG